MEILGYIASLLMGIVLGTIGGGGSILTVPILVYLFNVSPITATAYSLFIVGFTSLMGSLSYIKKNEVSFSTFIKFAIPSIIAVYLTRLLIIPSLPNLFFENTGFEFSKDTLIMVIFAILMVAASVSMIKKINLNNGDVENKGLIIVLEGVVVGVLTGLVGAGGGFLIIPALVLLAKLPMKIAVGTSLMIISVKSLIGFLGDLSTDIYIDWILLLSILILSIIGVIIGSYVSTLIDGKKLKPVFGWFVLAMGLYVLIKEVFI